MPWRTYSIQNLMVGHLVDADHPIAPLGQAVGVGIAPGDLLGPLLERRVQPGCPPVAGPMGLQIDVVQDPADRPRADGRDDAVGDGLPGQVLARDNGSDNLRMESPCLQIRGGNWQGRERPTRQFGGSR